VKQIANVAALPGIVGRSIGLPDMHSGYGFAIGNMAAFDMDDPKAVVSPGDHIFLVLRFVESLLYRKIVPSNDLINRIHASPNRFYTETGFKDREKFIEKDL